jgi:indolepyruvate ferredoxin oxidoreductase beta subunit
LISLPEESLLLAIKELFKHKSERIINKNIEAFQTGKSIAKQNTDFVY